MSKNNRNILICFNKGYVIDEYGNVKNKDKLLKCSVNINGYLKFSIRTKTESSTPVFVHKLQAYFKYGNKIFEKGIVVRHLNGNKLDNSFENIAIGTQQDNMLDKPKHKRIEWASHPKYDYESIKKDRLLGMTYRELMNKYNISSKGTISYIINK